MSEKSRIPSSIMKTLAFCFANLTMLAAVVPAFAQDRSLDESIRARSDASWDQARKIWEWAEVGCHEERSSALLADSLQAAGFQVERGVAGIPTASNSFSTSLAMEATSSNNNQRPDTELEASGIEVEPSSLRPEG